MPSRVELARRQMELMSDGKMDEALAMLADDVVASNPMTGTLTGKAAVEASIRNRPGGMGGGNIQWSDPVEEGDTVKIIGTGSPFGSIKIALGFNASDQINKIDIGLA